jgi:hypothetical protein
MRTSAYINVEWLYLIVGIQNKQKYLRENIRFHSLLEVTSVCRDACYSVQLQTKSSRAGFPNPSRMFGVGQNAVR